MCIARTEPIVVPDYPIYCGQHVWELSKDVFTYVDETDRFVDTLFSSFADAVDACQDYANWLNGVNHE